MMECYSAIKRNDLLIDAKTRVNPENLRLSEECQLQKATFVLLHLQEMLSIDKSIETQSRRVVVWGWGTEGMKGYCSWGFLLG